MEQGLAHSLAGNNFSGSSVGKQNTVHYHGTGPNKKQKKCKKLHKTSKKVVK